MKYGGKHGGAPHRKGDQFSGGGGNHGGGGKKTQPPGGWEKADLVRDHDSPGKIGQLTAKPGRRSKLLMEKRKGK